MGCEGGATIDDILDDFARIARRCERAARVFDGEPLRSILVRLDIATKEKEVGRAASGSWIGHHASLYLEKFRPPRGHEHFNSEWGLEQSYSNTTNGPWRAYSSFEVNARSGLRRK
jgi:hypothetical protein